MASTVKPFAFVLMPFSNEFDDIYRLGIKAACEDRGVVAERVDEQKFSETMLDRIYRQIEYADFIIADMSGRNPNVFYEVGYAHARGKICTLLTSDSHDIPFDLKHHRHIVYNDLIVKLKDALCAELDWLKAESKTGKSKSISLEIQSSSGFLEDKDWAILGTFDISIDLHNKSERRSSEIESIYLYTSNKWNFVQSGEECPVGTTEDGPKKYRTLIKPPVSRLSSGGWAQFKLRGKREFWNKWGGSQKKDEYTYSGPLHFEVHTSEGIMKYSETVTVVFDDIPF